ncbi:MAG: fatty acid desaturase, partial [Bacteroidota bacterium]
MDVNERNLVLATKPYAKDDNATSWRHLLTTIFVLSVLYAGTLIPSHWAIQLVFSVITGFTLVRMFIIYHDYLHKTILRRSPLANIIFSIFGLYILAPKSIWRRSHDYHHKHNSKLYTTSIGSFPIVTKKKFLAMSPGQRKMYLFIRHPLTIGFGYIFAFLFGMCIQPLLRSPQKHLDCALSILFHFTIGYLMWHFFGLTSFLCGFVAVSFLTGAMGSYLFYAQHNFPAARFEDKEGWTYVKAALQSS